MAKGFSIETIEEGDQGKKATEVAFRGNKNELLRVTVLEEDIVRVLFSSPSNHEPSKPIPSYALTRDVEEREGGVLPILFDSKIFSLPKAQVISGM